MYHMGYGHFLCKKETPGLHGAMVSVCFEVKAKRVIW